MVFLYVREGKVAVGVQIGGGERDLTLERLPSRGGRADLVVDRGILHPPKK